MKCFERSDYRNKWLMLFGVVFLFGCTLSHREKPPVEHSQLESSHSIVQQTASYEESVSESSQSALNDLFECYREHVLISLDEEEYENLEGIVIPAYPLLEMEEFVTRLAIPEVVHIENCKKYFLNKFRSDYLAGLERRKHYAKMIRDKVRERRMPESVSWIPMVESWFDVSARSPSHAVGLWQLMPAIARQFGLRIDEWIDERKDPDKSTDAALDFLEYLYDKTGCWFTTFAAYHSGEGCINRAFNRTGLTDYWALTQAKALPLKTRFYVSAILALASIERDLTAHNIVFPIDVDTNLSVVSLTKQIDIRSMCKIARINVDDVFRCNPELAKSVTPPNYPGYELKIPVLFKDRVSSALETASLNKTTNWVEYVVEPGDTLSALAQRFNTSIDRIRDANQLVADKIISGKKLLIPGS